MPAVLDISTDFETCVDGLIAVTYRPAVNPNTERITNGTFDSALTGWTTSGSPTWEDGMALVPGGSGINQQIFTTSGLVYKGSVLAYLAGSPETFRVRIGTAAFGSDIADIQWGAAVGSARREFSFTATAATAHVSVTGQLHTWRLDDFTIKASADTAITKAMRRPVALREILASEGRYRAGDTRWSVQANRLASPPQPGDRFTDAAGEVWTCLEGAKHTMDTRWLAISRSLSIRPEAATLLDFYRLTPSKDAAHGEVYAPMLVAADVRANLHIEDAADETQHGQRAGVKRATITSEIPLPITATNPLMQVTVDGVVYTYLRTVVPASITELPRYEFEYAPWRVR